MEYGYRETRQADVYDSRDSSCDSRKKHHSLLGKIADAVENCNEKAVELAQDQVVKREEEECQPGYARKHKSILTKAVEAAEDFVAKQGDPIRDDCDCDSSFTYEHTEECRRYGSGCICHSRTTNSSPYSSPVVANANYGYSTEDVCYENNPSRLDSATRANVNVEVENYYGGVSKVRVKNTEVTDFGSSTYQSTRVGSDDREEYQRYVGASRSASAYKGDDLPYSRRVREDYGSPSRITEGGYCEKDPNRTDSSTRAYVNVEVEKYGGVNKVRMESTEVTSSGMGGCSVYRSRDCESDGSDGDGENNPWYEEGSHYESNHSKNANPSRVVDDYGHSRRTTEDGWYESHSRCDHSSTRATTSVEVENYDGFSKLSLESTEVSTSNDGNRATCWSSRVCGDGNRGEYPLYDGGARFGSDYQSRNNCPSRAVDDYSYPGRTTNGCEDDSTRTTVNVKLEVEVDNDRMGIASGVYGSSAYEDRNERSRRTYESAFEGRSNSSCEATYASTQHYGGCSNNYV